MTRNARTPGTSATKITALAIPNAFNNNINGSLDLDSISAADGEDKSVEIILGRYKQKLAASSSRIKF